MKSIAFVDIEADPKSEKILDYGGLTSIGQSCHTKSAEEFGEFIRETDYLCGHNIFNHDLKYLGNLVDNLGRNFQIIDTLYLSPLLFPEKPYHPLGKDEKFHSEEANNPLNDCIKTKNLLDDLTAKFSSLDENLKKIFYALLKPERQFEAFFSYIDYQSSMEDLPTNILNHFKGKICENVNWPKLLQRPLEMALCLSLIDSNDRYSIVPKWALLQHPYIESGIFSLRNSPCVTGCQYCNQKLDAKVALKEFFGFEGYRKYEGEPLQEKAVDAAINNKSLLAVFPTGGGKSLTFQVPALMCGRNEKSLTVVISPLQSLMKDQVDTLEARNINDAVAINSLLDPIERSKSIRRVADGEATMLYISPESLRSKTIERLLLGRKIARFVIDEAHCFSSWGQDFRVDYLYIGKFIREFRRKKNIEEAIPVSCFTATAKQKVIEDICAYFKHELQLDLEIIASKASRKNLKHGVFQAESEEQKFNQLRNLIEIRECPSIVYVSRTRKAEKIASKLRQDGFDALAYHGKLSAEEKNANQEAFMSGKVKIMVATSAFGMGVDKSDVGMVVHYEISDSLENYVQEAGRAGRDESVNADCYVLFNEDDLGAHFILLNQTKLNFHEIKKFWQGIKELTKSRSKGQYSALEIARKAGWNSERKNEVETRVKTALAALEESKYLERGQNAAYVYADSIRSETVQQAIDKIMASSKFGDELQKQNAVRVIKNLFSSKSRKHILDESETRVDYIADILGIKTKEVIRIITILREEQILADGKDLTAFIHTGDSGNQSLLVFETFRNIEDHLCPLLSENELHFNIKALNTDMETAGIRGVTTDRIKTLLNFWAIKKWIIKKTFDPAKNHFMIVSKLSRWKMRQKLAKRHQLSRFIVTYLFDPKRAQKTDEANPENVLVCFSVLELKQAYETQTGFFSDETTIDEVEDSLFYLSRIGAIKIEDGFLVVYNRLSIERKEMDGRAQYKQHDYAKLKEFYDNKIEQIHIVGEYARLMHQDENLAQQYVQDYFNLNGTAFINKYFPNRKEELQRNLTPKKYRQLFEPLSPQQRKIIDDKSKYMTVAAGPGSGKTTLLAHKLASLIYTEDIKTEELLMLTFSRQAATEFRLRLLKLIGKAAHFVQINTFHAYCFDLMGRIGDLDHTSDIINTALKSIEAGEIEPDKINKSVLVIDEAQDMDASQFGLIKALMDKNPGMRVIAVGDDDQNIFTFANADSKFMMQFGQYPGGVAHELTVNYRAKENLVDFAERFVSVLPRRLRQSPMTAYQSDFGTLEITSYANAHLIRPLLESIENTALSGSTCILTFTNEDVYKIAGALTSMGRNVRMIGKDDKFRIRDLVEVAFFRNELNAGNSENVITDEDWENAKYALYRRYGTSENYEICHRLIDSFEKANLKMYFSDFDTFLYESRWEHFYEHNSEVITVSTIHKAKGKEFDNVYIMLESTATNHHAALRCIYVAMTRAKANLYIHEHTGIFDQISFPGLTRKTNNGKYVEPEILAVHLTHTSVNLGYFRFLQPQVSQLISGQMLNVHEFGCDDASGQRVLNFSAEFLETLKQKAARGYVVSHAKVKDMVYWKNDQMAQPVIIVLPEVHFQLKKA